MEMDNSPPVDTPNVHDDDPYFPWLQPGRVRSLETDMSTLTPVNIAWLRAVARRVARARSL